MGGGVLHSTAVAYLLLTQHSQKKFREKIIGVAEVNQWCWLEESGQWLQNVDRTHLLLASGKPVLKKVQLGVLGPDDFFDGETA